MVGETTEKRQRATGKETTTVFIEMVSRTNDEAMTISIKTIIILYRVVVIIGGVMDVIIINS